MVELGYTLFLWVLYIALPYAITRRDRRSLTSEQLARSWNTASWASAVYFFGPLCLPAHFWVTRRTVRGLAMGIGWMLSVFLCAWLVGVALDRLATGG